MGLEGGRRGRGQQFHGRQNESDIRFERGREVNRSKTKVVSGEPCGGGRDLRPTSNEKERTPRKSKKEPRARLSKGQTRDGIHKNDAGKRRAHSWKDAIKKKHK